MTNNNDFNKIEDLYFSGQYGEAFSRCLDCAKQGNHKCQRFLGWIYYSGKNGLVDYEKAMEWFQKAIESNDAEAMYGLANIYYVKKDFQKAITWYLRSEKSGFIPARFRVGLMYQHGLGIEKDKKIAFQYYSSAASSGNLPAERACITLLLAGIGGTLGRILAVPKLLIVIVKTFFIALKDPNDQRLMS